MSEDIKQLPAPLPKPAEQSVRLWPLWLLLIILLLAMLGLVFFASHQWQLNQRLEQSIEQLSLQENNGLTSQSGRLNDLSGQLDRVASQQSLHDQQLEKQALQLSHVAGALLEAGHRSRTDWLLAEVEYLLRLANQRLQTEQDFNGALSILVSADQVLRETDDPGTFPVREQLAREMLALRAVQPVDQTGLYLQLEALVDRVSRLTDGNLTQRTPLAQVSTPAAMTAAADENTPVLDTAWSRLQASLQNVIVIRRMDEPVKPLLSPEQSAYARLNLQLMLEQAETALMRGHQALYQRSLEKVRQTLDAWYDASQPEIAALRDSLAALIKHNIRPDIPDISQSLKLLKARLSGRHQPRAAAEGPSKAPAEEPRP